MTCKRISGCGRSPTTYSNMTMAIARCLLLALVPTAVLSLNLGSDDMKYVLLTNGVTEGIGRASVAGSLGSLLLDAGWDARGIALNPMFNLDGGTLDPLKEKFERGEWYVLDDGGLVLYEMGYYERFMGIAMTSNYSITNGHILRQLLHKERSGDFFGEIVRAYPHQSGQTINAIANSCSQAPQFYLVSLEEKKRVFKQSDMLGKLCLIQLTGTVGLPDTEAFLSALRELKQQVGPQRFAHVHLTMVPEMSERHGPRIEPAKMSYMTLNNAGIAPDVVILRSVHLLEQTAIAEMTAYTFLDKSRILRYHTQDLVYKVPVLLSRQNITSTVSRLLGKPLAFEPRAASWTFLSHIFDEHVHDTLNLVMIGKYAAKPDSYTTVIDSLQQAAFQSLHRARIHAIDSIDLQETYEDDVDHSIHKTPPSRYRKAWAKVEKADAIVMAGGSGARGFEGLVAAAHYARTHKKPMLSVCLAFQATVVEYGRNVMGLTGADSQEIDPQTPYPVISSMPFYDPAHPDTHLKLGKHWTFLEEGSFLSALYGGKKAVQERFLHSFGFNPDYVNQYNEAGLLTVATNDHRNRSDAVVLPRDVHPFYVATQFHPEYHSRPMKPTPTMLGLVLAASGKLDQILERKGEYYEHVFKIMSEFLVKSDEELGSKTVDLRLDEQVEEPDDHVIG